MVICVRVPLFVVAMSHFSNRTMLGNWWEDRQAPPEPVDDSTVRVWPAPGRDPGRVVNAANGDGHAVLADPRMR